MGRRSWGWGAAVLSALFPRGEARGEDLFWSRRHACNQGCIRSYNQDSFAGVRQASLDLFNAVGVPEVLVTGVANQPTVRRKTYRGNTGKLEIGDLTVSDIALQLRDSGLLTASCRLAFGGGTERALDGTNVTLRLRAFTGSPGAVSDSSQMAMIWESLHELWVPTGRTVVTSIVPSSDYPPVHARPRIQTFGRSKHSVKTNSNTVDYRSAGVPLFVDQFEEINLFQLSIERHIDR